MIKSPSRKAVARTIRGAFTPTLPPIVGELPKDVETLFQSMNRKARRQFAANARAHGRAKAKAEARKAARMPTVPWAQALRDLYPQTLP